jgi:hypothetical protein
MNIKSEIKTYLEKNPKALTRPTGHLPTGKVNRQSFHALKGNREVITMKDVRETVWRNNSMAVAMAEAIR